MAISIDRRNPVTARIEEVMERHSHSVIDREGVIGVGVGWREHELKFVVQAEHIEDAERLKRELPSAVQGFPLYVEVGRMARAAGARGRSSTESTPRKLGLLSRLLTRFRVNPWLTYRLRSDRVTQ